LATKGPRLRSERAWSTRATISFPVPLSPSTSTVPVVIYTMLRTGLTPTINALSVVLIIVMLVVALSSRRLTSS
jgi:ABC-type spermidine/putrescine transport system permease subunit II